MLKLLELNGYLKGDLKSRINKLPNKININFLLANADLLEICVYLSRLPCLMIETIPTIQNVAAVKSSLKN